LDIKEQMLFEEGGGIGKEKVEKKTKENTKRVEKEIL